MNSFSSYSILNESEKFLCNSSVKICEAEGYARIITTLKRARRWRYDDKGNSYYYTSELRLRGNIKKSKLRNLAILSWYLPVEIRSLLILAIDERIGNNINLFDIRLLLKSKGLMKSYLLEYCVEKGPSALFGSLLKKENFPIDILNTIQVKVMKSYMEYFEKSTIKKPKPFIGVGYKDKHPRPLNSNGNLFKDFTLDSIQLKIEEDRYHENSIIALIEGFLE